MVNETKTITGVQFFPEIVFHKWVGIPLEKMYKASRGMLQ